MLINYQEPKDQKCCSWRMHQYERFMLNRRLWHAGLDEYLFHSGREGCLIRPHAGNDATGCQETEGNLRHDIMDGTVFELQYHLQQGSVEATDLMGVRNIVAYVVHCGGSTTWTGFGWTIPILEHDWGNWVCLKWNLIATTRRGEQGISQTGADQFTKYNALVELMP